MRLLLLRNCSVLAKHAPSFPAYLPQVKDHCNKLWLLARWTLRPVSEGSSLPKCYLQYSKFSIKCSGQFLFQWTLTLFEILEIRFHLGSQLNLSSCLISKPMETGIGDDSFFHFCGHERIELLRQPLSMALSQWIPTSPFNCCISPSVSFFV